MSQDKLKLVIEITPEYHNFCKDKGEFISTLRGTIENELDAGDLHGELHSIREYEEPIVHSLKH